LARSVIHSIRSAVDFHQPFFADFMLIVIKAFEKLGGNVRSICLRKMEGFSDEFICRDHD
jgi:hypothetical protein